MQDASWLVRCEMQIESNLGLQIITFWKVIILREYFNGGDRGMQFLYGIN